MGKRFKRKLSSYFDGPDFSQSLDNQFADMSLDGSFATIAGSADKRFLNRFTGDQLMEILNQVGLKKHLEKKGFPNLLVTIDQDESKVHYFKLYTEEVNPESILLDLRLSESKLCPPEDFFSEKVGALTFDMIVIEWLSAQNPRGKFSGDKPQLPGQKRPGLGVLNFCFEMMYVVAREVTRDGFMDIPDHMHGAVMYSRKFRFINPAHEAVLRAIIRDLEKYSLSDISWGMITETIYSRDTGKPQVYDPSEQVFPVSDRMYRYFQSGTYRSRYEQVYKKKRYDFDYKLMVQKRDEILKNKNIVEL